MTDEGLLEVAKSCEREDLERIFVMAEKAKQEMRIAGIGWTGLDFLETAREAIRMLNA